mgnify:CR=1 FL=1
MKNEHYVQVQRRKSLRYGEKQHYQDYITIPIELSRFLELQPGQVMRCATKNRAILTYTKAEGKPKNKMAYQEWIKAIGDRTPSAGEQGKTHSQICKEANLSLRSAPAFWVKQAEHDIGLIRRRDGKTHRMLWTRTSAGQHLQKRLRDPTLTELIGDIDTHS